MISDDDYDELGATPPMYGRCHDGPMMYIIYDGVSRPVHCSAATDETMTYSRAFLVITLIGMMYGGGGALSGRYTYHRRVVTMHPHLETFGSCEFAAPVKIRLVLLGMLFPRQP